MKTNKELKHSAKLCLDAFSFKIESEFRRWKGWAQDARRPPVLASYAVCVCVCGILAWSGSATHARWEPGDKYGSAGGLEESFAPELPTCTTQNKWEWDETRLSGKISIFISFSLAAPWLFLSLTAGSVNSRRHVTSKWRKRDPSVPWYQTLHK